MNAIAQWAGKARPDFRSYLCLTCLWLAAFTVFPRLTSAQVLNTQLQPQTASAEPTRTYTLTGTVVNALTGEPINRALVQIAGGQPVMTASDGSFEFTGIPSGQTYLMARKPGFFSEPEIYPGRTPQYVKPAEAKDPIVLKLIPQSVITGRITDSAGEPIENLSVGLVYESFQDGRKRFMPNGQTMTNENGEYRLPQLRPGRYFLFMGPALAALPIEFGPVARAGNKGFAKTYFPGVRNRAAAAPITIAPGQHANVDFILEAVPLHKVSGRIVGAPPKPAPALQVFSPDGDDASPLSNFYNPLTGEFRLSLPQGVFIIKAYLQTLLHGREQMLQGQTGVNVAADLDNIMLALAPAASAPIEIRLESTKPDSPFSSSSFHPNAYVRLFPEDPLGSEQISQPESPQDPSPVLRNLEPGKYWVQVDNALPGYVQSVHCGSQDLAREILTVAAGQRLPSIEIVLRDDSATLAVSLRSENPHTTATVVVAGSGSLQNSLKIFQCPGNGSSGLNGLAPGDYTVYAFDNVANLEYRNPDVLAAYSSRAAHVTLAPNGKTNVVLDLIHAEE